MPRYYLNIEQDDEIIEDLEGSEFNDAESARREAIASARDMMGDKGAQGKGAAGSVINIVDDERRSILRVPFTEAIASV